MFTGLTNQVSGWMGNVVKKGEGEAGKPEDKAAEPGEEQPTSPQDNSEAKKDTSPTKPGGRLEMLSNVKSQMSGWLGSAAIPSMPAMPAMPAMPSIPGLRKGGDDHAADGAAATTVESPASEKSVKGSPGEPEKDDDNSSATGGADSNAEISDNEAEDLEKDGAVAGVSTKATQAAKSFGGFLYSAVSKAGAKVSEAGAKIKKTVEENPVNLPVKNLLGDFNKEQEAFIKDKNSKGSEAAVPPWVGCPNEESLKEECLSLSTDRRNFVRSPPAGVEFNFDYDVTFPVAQAILAEDPNLEKMRFELVPKIISEENFWRNYFYRVSLICQANELSSMAKEGGASASASRTSSTDAEPAEEDWEKELEAELQDYEVVADNDGQNSHSNNWEHQIEDMLDDETDLK